MSNCGRCGKEMIEKFEETGDMIGDMIKMKDKSMQCAYSGAT